MANIEHLLVSDQIWVKLEKFNKYYNTNEVE